MYVWREWDTQFVRRRRAAVGHERARVCTDARPACSAGMEKDGIVCGAYWGALAGLADEGWAGNEGGLVRGFKGRSLS